MKTLLVTKYVGVFIGGKTKILFFQAHDEVFKLQRLKWSMDFSMARKVEEDNKRRIVDQEKHEKNSFPNMALVTVIFNFPCIEVRD